MNCDFCARGLKFGTSRRHIDEENGQTIASKHYPHPMDARNRYDSRIRDSDFFQVENPLKKSTVLDFFLVHLYRDDGRRYAPFRLDTFKIIKVPTHTRLQTETFFFKKTFYSSLPNSFILFFPPFENSSPFRLAPPLSLPFPKKIPR